MRLPIDRESGTPLYRQIEAWLRAAIEAGTLPAGARLPATRSLAADLAVARVTVDAAYGELLADGLLEARGGGGTFVCAAVPAAPRGGWPAWQTAGGGRRPREEAGIEAAVGPGAAALIDLSGGTGDARVFPQAELLRALGVLRRGNAAGALASSHVAGHPELRAAIARTLTSQGLRCAPEHVLVTGGAQQAITLVARLLAREGEAVVVESPTYPGAIDLFRAMHLEVIGVPTDRDGMVVEALEDIAAARAPRFIYTIPNFHNPTGVCMSERRRRQLVALAERRAVPILEDDFVGELRYDGPALPTLKALAPQGRVLYTSTFSKMLAPGVQVGFLVAEGPVLSGLAELRRLLGLAGASVLQQALGRFIGIGRYRAYLKRSTDTYRARRDAALAALARHLPAATCTRPHGGLFVWVKIPRRLSAGDLLERCAAHGVAVAPGRRFFVAPKPDHDRFVRLNFASVVPEQIDEGVRRLARALGQRVRCL